MIINISDEEFKRIFEDTQFHLPLRWHNIDFADTLRLLFDNYLFRLEQCDMCSNRYASVSYDNSEIYAVCSLLVSAVRHYLNGFPSKAFCTFIGVNLTISCFFLYFSVSAIARNGIYI